ncbi:uncharacterized protein I303_104898 [Kwoniella dejecticola CBS 10117]|uniref:WSC domain-containing protein n=1 Tax=Kwoniella dejecticola CBS 10117 TaxID=1296121 RepID=A0A1A6A408_9TREE|nr:uncharacterized protein I303_05656 [Kwoniella dejecticola CBS 10117]OBR84797.1 hypothetical protein I303_05656 [Kwoniella dejecticola CBS 10117]
MLKPTIIISLLSFLSLHAAAIDYSETFLGCMGIGTSTNGALASPSASTAADCNAACAEAGYAYAYFASPASTYCSCKNVGPTPSQIQSSSSSGESCEYYMARSYALNTDYAFNDCWNAPDNDVNSAEDTIADCWNTCKTYSGAMVGMPSAGSTYFECYCSTNIRSAGGTSEIANCGSTDAFFSYLHTAEASPSLVDRRRRRQARRDQLALNLNTNVFCPEGLEACNLPGSRNRSSALILEANLNRVVGAYTVLSGIRPVSLGQTAQS